MRTRPHTPRTGRPRKLRVNKKFKRTVAGKKNPKQLAAARARKRKGRKR